MFCRFMTLSIFALCSLILFCLLCLSFLIVWRVFFFLLLLLPSFVFCPCLVPVLRAETFLLRERDYARYKSHVYYCYYSNWIEKRPGVRWTYTSPPSLLLRSHPIDLQRSLVCSSYDLLSAIVQTSAHSWPIHSLHEVSEVRGSRHAQWTKGQLHRMCPRRSMQPGTPHTHSHTHSPSLWERCVHQAYSSLPTAPCSRQITELKGVEELMDRQPNLNGGTRARAHTHTDAMRGTFQELLFSHVSDLAFDKNWRRKAAPITVIYFPVI